MTSFNFIEDQPPPQSFQIDYLLSSMTQRTYIYIIPLGVKDQHTELLVRIKQNNSHKGSILLYFISQKPPFYALFGKHVFHSQKINRLNFDIWLSLPLLNFVITMHKCQSIACKICIVYVDDKWCCLLLQFFMRTGGGLDLALRLSFAAPSQYHFNYNYVERRGFVEMS